MDNFNNKELLTMNKKEISRISIMQKIEAKEITQVKAAEILELTDRQVRRVFKNWEERGEAGLIHRLRGRPGNHSLPVELKQKAISIVKKKYSDFGPSLAAEHLETDAHLLISHDVLRILMIHEHLWFPKIIKPEHRERRERKECFGEMILFDGSDHAWFEDRGPKCTLLASRDDATNQVEAVFAGEDIKGVFKFWKDYIEKHGKPTQIYLDRHSVYKTTRPAQWKYKDDDVQETQFQRAARELSIKLIYARSPEAKGRIERLFGTLQDRLVKELRLKDISTIKQANHFLKTTFLPWFNQQFMVKPKNQANLHREIHQSDDLDRIFSVQTTRQINNDYTLSLDNQWFQLEKNQPILVLPSRVVIVEEWLDGSFQIRLNNTYLNFKTISKPIKPEKLKIPSKPRTYWIPPITHPWRTSFKEPLKTGHF